MNIIRDFVGGIVLVLKTMGAPLLYRYPYRNSAEGLRSDWLSIGKDIENVMGQIARERENERSGK